MATLGLLKIQLLWNKGYDVITLVLDVTSKILSRNSNYIVDMVMWPKFGNCGISMRKIIITSILEGFHPEHHFFDGWSGFKFNNSGLVLGTNLKSYASVAKGLK